MSTPQNLKYAETHEWISPEGAVGITDHAQSELSDIVFVELPEKGKQVKAGEAVAVVESVKAASDIYAPVSGEVLEANAELGNEPGLINSDPYEKGWIFKMKISDSGELEKLKSADEYKMQIGK